MRNFSSWLMELFYISVKIFIWFLSEVFERFVCSWRQQLRFISEAREAASLHAKGDKTQWKPRNSLDNNPLLHNISNMMLHW